MLSDFLKAHYKSQAKYVEYGYGQVEPNHLSAQRTGQIYAQLPAHKDIAMLEQGQFVKYDYATGLVDFTGEGEWMLVYNEIKLYREGLRDCEFAMVKDNYMARVYSPYQYDPNAKNKQSRYYNGVDSNGDPIEDVTAPPDPYELNYNEDPFHFEGKYKEAMMPEGTTMVPRVFKTNVGDIFTTNMIDEEAVEVGDILSPRAADGILCKSGDGTIRWQVVKVYTMPDNQKGVKIMRIA